MRSAIVFVLLFFVGGVSLASALTTSLPSDTNVKFVLESYSGIPGYVLDPNNPVPPNDGDMLSGVMRVDDIYDEDDQGTKFIEGGDNILGFFEGLTVVNDSQHLFSDGNILTSIYEVRGSSFGLYSDINGLGFDSNLSVQDVKALDDTSPLVFSGEFSFFKSTFDLSSGDLITEAYINISPSADSSIWGDDMWVGQGIDIDGWGHVDYDIKFTAVSTLTGGGIWEYYSSVADDPLFGRTVQFAQPPTPIPDPVPEPSTWVLLSSGLLGLTWFNRRRNKK